MVDINFVRENKELFKKAVEGKGIDLDVEKLLAVDEKRREFVVKIDALRQQRNETAEKRDIDTGKQIKEKLGILEEEFKKVQTEFDSLMVKVPTIPASDTPPGESEKDNVVIEEWGEKPKFGFTPKDHIQLGKELDILDFERGAKVGGYRGYFVKNEGVILQFALMMYALNKMVEKGYKPMIPPTLVKGFALFGSGYFKSLNYNPETDEIYEVSGITNEKKFLIGTAEPALLAYYSNEVLESKDLPLKLCGFSQCYRSEIGSYGKETKGLYRVHEFMKIEQVVLSLADVEVSDKLQQEMIAITKEIHEELGLPYRVIRICMGDLGPGKYKQFDFEVWMPGLDRFGETGSASNFFDWQARRLNVKYKYKDDNTKYVYMLNNTALPTPRPIIAILENFQQEDGTVIIPEVLRKYTGFSEIKPKKPRS